MAICGSMVVVPGDYFHYLLFPSIVGTGQISLQIHINNELEAERWRRILSVHHPQQQPVQSHFARKCGSRGPRQLQHIAGWMPVDMLSYLEFQEIPLIRIKMGTSDTHVVTVISDLFLLFLLLLLPLLPGLDTHSPQKKWPCSASRTPFPVLRLITGPVKSGRRRRLD